MSDEISKALGLSNITTVTPVEKLPVVKPEAVDQDYEYARGNMIATIEKGQEALNGILEVAGMGQHPRAYEVAAKLIDSLTAANKDLLTLKKQQRDLEGETGSSVKTVNNNLFVGSTAELQAFLKKQNELKN